VAPDWHKYHEKLKDGLTFTWLGHAVRSLPGLRFGILKN
jgi:hypothetical protein